MAKGTSDYLLLLLYASQNGTAKGIAEDLYEVCVSGGLVCELKCCSQVDVEHLEEVTCLVLVASTTGEKFTTYTRHLYNR